jgi:thioesterase domain-containing protein
MGWSLGGTIALEMAAILEASGIKKIHVILLDTLVQDEFMKTFITRKYVEDAMKQAQEELRDAALQGHDVAYVEKVNLAIDAEIEMMRSPLSGFLKHTSVTLFKAMRVDMFKVLKDGKFKNEYVRMLSSNNVDLIANKVHVINLDCYHNDILQTNSETIGKYLLSSSYLNAVERKRLRAVSC